MTIQLNYFNPDDSIKIWKHQFKELSKIFYPESVNSIDKRFYYMKAEFELLMSERKIDKEVDKCCGKKNNHTI